MSVRIAGVVLPAQILKQGTFEDVDLSLLLVDHASIRREAPEVHFPLTSNVVAFATPTFNNKQAVTLAARNV